MGEKNRRKQKAKQQRKAQSEKLGENLNVKANSTKWWVYAILIVVTLGALFPVLQSEFLLYDDQKLIVENKLVTDGSAVKLADFFERQKFSPHWKPLVYLSWNIQGQISGVKSFPFHLVNLLFHMANVVMVFWLARILIKRWVSNQNEAGMLALGVGLLFAVHPLHVESVAWATERKDVLYSFFYLMSMICYVRYLTQPKAMRWLVLSVITYLLVIGSKAMGITLVAVLFVLDFIYNRKGSIKLVYEKAGHFVVLLFAMFIYGMFGDFGDNIQGLTAGIATVNYEDYPAYLNSLPDPYLRILIICFRFLGWLFHTLIPINIAVYYPRLELIQIPGQGIHLFPWIVMGLVFWAWKTRKSKPWLAAGLLFFGISILPALAIPEKGTGIFLADRFTYLPMFGILLAVIMLLYHALGEKNKKWLYRGLGIVVLLLGLSSFKVAQTWKTTDALMSRVLDKFESIPSAYLNQGRVKSQEKNYQKAIEYYTTAIKLDSKYGLAYQNRSMVYHELGEYEKALEDCHKAVLYMPTDGSVYSGRGGIYAKLRRFDEALADLDKAAELNPNFAATYVNQGYVYLQTNRPKEAIEPYKRSVELDGSNVTAWIGLGLGYYLTQDYQNAIQSFNSCLSVDPNNGNALINRSYAYNKTGNIQQALSDAEQAYQRGVQRDENYVQQLRAKL